MSTRTCFLSLNIVYTDQHPSFDNKSVTTHNKLTLWINLDGHKAAIRTFQLIMRVGYILGCIAGINSHKVKYKKKASLRAKDWSLLQLYVLTKVICTLYYNHTHKKKQQKEEIGAAGLSNSNLAPR